jgi:hypothetical protein
MPATPIASSVRFFRPGITSIVFVPTIADYTAPTRIEINAGTDLSNELAEVAGWKVVSENIDAPDFASTFVGKVAGKTSVEDSSLTMYASSDTTDVRTLLPRGTTGYILRMDGGDVATQKMDVFPVTVSALGKVTDTSNAAHIEIDFAVTKVPAEDVAIPT